MYINLKILAVLLICTFVTPLMAVQEHLIWSEEGEKFEAEFHEQLNRGFVDSFSHFLSRKRLEEGLPTQVLNLSVNQHIPVPIQKWVDARWMVQDNLGKTTIGAKKRCVLEVGERLIIALFSADSQMAFVATTRGAPTPSCPQDAFFFLSVEELASFEESYATSTPPQESRYDIIQLILSRSDNCL